MVDIIAEAYFISHVDWVLLDVQEVLLTFGERQADLQVCGRLEVCLATRRPCAANLRAAVRNRSARTKDRQVAARHNGIHATNCCKQLPLGLLMAETAHDSVMHCGEEPFFADRVCQSTFSEGPVQAVAHHGKSNLNASSAEVVHNVLQHIKRCRVHADNGSHFQNDVLRSVDVLQGGDTLLQPVLDEVGVREIYAAPNPGDEDVRHEGSMRVLLDVPVDGGSRKAPQNRDLWPHRFVDDNGQ
mmetsp:Transcript_88502/g.122816  ORF Transcript_88502/g.122816 Transcript_88502/m.122816 type:complete len:243 (+) Transcript_88502:609-1337(+)